MSIAKKIGDFLLFTLLFISMTISPFPPIVLLVAFCKRKAGDNKDLKLCLVIFLAFVAAMGGIASSLIGNLLLTALSAFVWVRCGIILWDERKNDLHLKQSA